MALLQHVEGQLHALQGRPADLASGAGQRQQNAELGGVRAKHGFDGSQALQRCVGTHIVWKRVGQPAQGVEFGLHVAGGAVPCRQFGHEQVAGMGIGKAIGQEFELRYVEVMAGDLAEQCAGFSSQVGVVGIHGHRQIGGSFPVRL